MNDGTVIDRREVRFVDYVNRAAFAVDDVPQRD
jgi:hypothetical protein